MGCVVTADLWLKSVSDCSIFFYLVIKPFHLVYLYLKFSTVYCLSYRYYYNDLMFEILLASNGFSLSFCKTLWIIRDWKGNGLRNTVLKSRIILWLVGIAFCVFASSPLKGKPAMLFDWFFLYCRRFQHFVIPYEFKVRDPHAAV